MTDNPQPVHPTAANAESGGEFEILETAVRELAIAHGYFSAADHRQWLEWMDAATPALGAKLVAHAWVDPAYNERALADGTAAAEEIGITNYDRAPLIVMANTPLVHNLVVCTLCSCYPRALLGLPPDWYKTPFVPAPGSALAPRAAGGVRHRHPARGRDPGTRLQRQHAVPGPADASGRDRGLE